MDTPRMQTLGRADARIAVAAAWFWAWQTWVHRLDRQVGRFIAHVHLDGCAQNNCRLSATLTRTCV